MNREILFRGKNENIKKWVYGLLLEFLKGDCYIYECPDNLDVDKPDALDMYAVNPETVGQYTGLTDKNGVKIFEGDIIKWHDEWIDCDFVGVVEFDHCSAAFKIRVSNELTSLLDCEYTIKIGNIHDNSELMGGTENENEL